MKPILLLGGGGHCHSCIDVIETTGLYQIQGVIQPTPSFGSVLGYPIIGSDHDLPRLLEDTPLALVTVGQLVTPNLRISLFDKIEQFGADLPIIKSPKAHCSKRRFGQRINNNDLHRKRWSKYRREQYSQ